jgi:BirA family biotin operon repressor/biotin-[acetyl-CoA-carboxylase] ligase
MAAAGFPAGTVVAADRQTASRGRFRDRTWESEPGRDLTFTVILPGDVGSLPGLPLRAGLALCRTIETYVRELRLEIREELRIKWPNDLLSGGRKLAGILCESSPGFCYLGVGVNCGKPENASFRTPASGLSEELGAPVDRFRLLELFLERLARVVKEDDWRAEVTRRLWLQG